MESTPARSIRASSGSLSPPTPSPPRASATLPHNQARFANKSARAAGLESGSDSSELTDEDEFAQRTKKIKKRSRGRGVRRAQGTTAPSEQPSRRPHSRGTSESTVNGAQNGGSSGSGGTSASGSQTHSNSRSSRRSGVIVPPTMWEWAYKKNNKSTANGLGLDIAGRDRSPSRSHSSGPEPTKPLDAQLSEGEIDENPMTATSEPITRRTDKPTSSTERPGLIAGLRVATDGIDTPISGANTNATTPRPSPNPTQPNSRKASPLDDPASTSDQDPDETKSDTEMPVDEPEPNAPKVARRGVAEVPAIERELEGGAEPEEEAPLGNGSKASIEPELEDEPEPEQDPEPEAEIEADPEMQPPHRAEALDVLAGMEMRFAELRERLYVDKMEEAAREEAMILDGTHPELILFQRQLDDRRTRRKQLAETRRTLEIGWCGTIRRAEEAATWSEWRHARDDLRDTMRTDYARKRRRLEREKRGAERPISVRPIPLAPLSLPSPPSLKSLLKLHANPQQALTIIRATPSLTPLSHHEAMADLELMTPRPVYFHPNSGVTSSGQFTYHTAEEEAYARSRGMFSFRPQTQSTQYPPALAHSYVVAPAPAWDGSTARRRERDRDREYREPVYDSPILVSADKEDKRPMSSSTTGWTATGEREIDPWDREQARESQRKIRELPRDPDLERERDRPVSTPFVIQSFTGMPSSGDVEMATVGSRPLSRNVER